MNRLRITLGMLALVICGSKLLAWAALAFDTHLKITRDVISSDILGIEYPDIVRFANLLQTGSDTESHDIPDANRTEWWEPKTAGMNLDERIWYTAGRTQDGHEGALSLYNRDRFGQAYETIGYEIHLLQDSTAPAHIKYCHHGAMPYPVDDMEYWARFRFGYANTTTPWIYRLRHWGGTNTFSYWLSDNEDDDNANDLAEGPADELSRSGIALIDGPLKWGVGGRKWGTYGQPPYVDSFTFPLLLEQLPGRDKGLDVYGDIFGNAVIMHEQLWAANRLTLERLKERSKGLPPVVSERSLEASASIFGPKVEEPVIISFTVLENRLPRVELSLKIKGVAIKDSNGKTWDGGENAVVDLARDNDVNSLPWKSKINIFWKGDLAEGKLTDGNHAVAIQATDLDDNQSVVRSLNIKYDTTEPKVGLNTN